MVTHHLKPSHWRLHGRADRRYRRRFSPHSGQSCSSEQVGPVRTSPSRSPCRKNWPALALCRFQASVRHTCQNICLDIMEVVDNSRPHLKLPRKWPKGHPEMKGSIGAYDRALVQSPIKADRTQKLTERKRSDKTVLITRVEPNTRHTQIM